jgi:hypothetical protein
MGLGRQTADPDQGVGAGGYEFAQMGGPDKLAGFRPIVGPAG